MNYHTYNTMRFCDSQIYKALYVSCLEAKTPHKAFGRRWLVVEKIAVAIKNVVDAWDVLQSSVARQ